MRPVFLCGRGDAAGAENYGVIFVPGGAKAFCFVQSIYK